MNKKKIFLLGFLLVTAAVAIYAYKEYNRKAETLADKKPDLIVEANKLAEEFESAEQLANQKYLGKLLQVSGRISGIQKDNLVNIILGEPGAMHSVSFVLDTVYSASAGSYKTGDNISLKGICTGYLIDVELNRAVIVP